MAVKITPATSPSVIRRIDAPRAPHRLDEIARGGAGR
jgi:hypothetical protein